MAPVRLARAAGLTAGSMPTKGTPGNPARSGWRAAAEAVLQATTRTEAPHDRRNRAIPSLKRSTSSGARGP